MATNTQSAAANIRTSASNGIVSARSQQTVANNARIAPDAAKSGAVFSFIPTSGSSGGGDSPSNNNETIINQAVDSPETKVNQPQTPPPTNTRYDDKKANELSADELEKILGDPTLTLNTEEIDVLKKALEEKERNSQKNNDNVFKYKGRCDDPDFVKPEDQKIDIQQGDFIEFLMKDVVLATTAWGLSKASKWVGVGAYETCAWTWHKILDGKEAKEKDDEKRAKERAAKHAEKADKQRKESHGTEPVKGKDKTTTFANQIFSLHDHDIAKPCREADEANAFFHLTKAAIEKDENSFNEFLAKKEFSQDHPLVKLAKDRANYFQSELKKDNITDPKAIEEQKQNYLNIIASTTEKQATLAISCQTFCANYAAATMLQEKAKNPDAFANSNFEQEFQKQKETEAKKLFYLEVLKFSRGSSDYKNLEEFTQTSVEAYKTAHNNIEKGLYAENGKLGQNEPLKKLQKSLDDPKSEYKELSAQNMKEVAMAYTRSEDEGNKTLAYINDRIKGYEVDAQNNNYCRQQVRATKEKIKGQGNTKKEQTKPSPTINQTKGRE